MSMFDEVGFGPRGTAFETNNNIISSVTYEIKELPARRSPKRGEGNATSSGD